MAKVDLEKLIGFILEDFYYSSDDAPLMIGDLRNALSNQRLVYKDGEIVPKPLTNMEKKLIEEDVKNGSTAKYSDLAYADEDMPDINKMVEKYRKRIMSGEFAFTANDLVEAALRDYKNGLEDMWNKLKGD